MSIGKAKNKDNCDYCRSESEMVYCVSWKLVLLTE